MNCAENEHIRQDEHGELSLAQIVLPLLTKVISKGRLPLLLRETIQFYLKHVAVFKARVLDNNRITIPKEEVDILGIKPGNHVVVILTKIEGGESKG